MSYSILSSEVKQQLEQERSRLRRDREAIIQSAVQQATIAIDRALQQLDSLLGESENNGSSSHLLDSEPQSDSSETPPQKTSTPKDQSSTKSKGKGRQSTVNRFNGKVLKPEFAHLSPIEAMVQVVNQAPKQTFDAETVINAVYDVFDPEDLPTAKRSVKITLVGGAKKGWLERVQENPPLFRAVTGAGSSAAPVEQPKATEVTSAEPDDDEPSGLPETSHKKASKVKAQPRARAKEKGRQSKSQSFNAKNPKRSFRGMEPLQAMVNVTATHPEQAFSTADIIREVYGEFEEAEMPRAIKSVAGTLTRGVQRGFLEKTQSNPALFKFKASGEESILAQEKEAVSA